MPRISLASDAARAQKGDPHNFKTEQQFCLWASLCLAPWTLEVAGRPLEGLDKYFGSSHLGNTQIVFRVVLASV